MITFTGTLKGLDKYNKVIILLDEPIVITNLSNEYHLIIPNKYKDYYIDFVETNKNERVTVSINTKRYCFDGKKGTSLLLKYMNLINERT